VVAPSAGATGSGKSTLFNALVGAEVSKPGVRRPTTGTPHASTWGEAGHARLLDWLGVPRRHVQDAPDPALDGLVLLDLPDHDSTAVEHRLEVDRVVELVDVPGLGARPAEVRRRCRHDRYLAPHAEHAACWSSCSARSTGSTTPRGPLPGRPASPARQRGACPPCRCCPSRPRPATVCPSCGRCSPTG
jgi:energy-coupling factor transporter ATP-binding protein EcfA2